MGASDEAQRSPSCRTLGGSVESNLRSLVLIDFDSFVADIESLYVSAVRATIRAPTTMGDQPAASKRRESKVMQKKFLESLLSESWGAHASVQKSANYFKLFLDHMEDESKNWEGKGISSSPSALLSLLRERSFELAEIVQLSFSRYADLVKPKVTNLSVLCSVADKLVDLEDRYKVCFVTSDLTTYKRVVHAWAGSLVTLKNKYENQKGQEKSMRAATECSALLELMGSSLMEWNGDMLSELEAGLTAVMTRESNMGMNAGCVDEKTSDGALYGGVTQDRYKSVIICSESSYLKEVVQALVQERSIEGLNRSQVDFVRSGPELAARLEEELLGNVRLPEWPVKVTSLKQVTSHFVERQFWQHVRPLRLPVFKGLIVGGHNRGATSIGCPTMNLDVAFSFDADINIPAANSSQPNVECSSCLVSNGPKDISADQKAEPPNVPRLPEIEHTVSSSSNYTGSMPMGGSADGVVFPLPGVYVGWCRILQASSSSSTTGCSGTGAVADFLPATGAWPCVMTAGFSPYYANAVGTLEVHVLHPLDPEKNFRGGQLVVEVVGAHRAESDFPAFDSLLGAIQMDCESALECLTLPPVSNAGVKNVGLSSESDEVSPEGSRETISTISSSQTQMGPSDTLVDSAVAARTLSVS